MEQLDMQLKSIQHKLQLILKQNQLLLRQNTALQKENEALKAGINEKENALQKLQQQIDIFKLSSNELGDDEKKELRKRIDIYLAEIEKCLVILNE
jgi:hypothetical protein